MILLTVKIPTAILPGILIKMLSMMLIVILVLILKRVQIAIF